MASYYVRTIPQLNGDHEVHTTGCRWLPEPQNRYYLGEFGSCVPAVVEAKKYFSQVNGCYFCSNLCHTQ